MKIYRVGGSVRDTIMGHPIKDEDFVVVGATTQQMLDLNYQKVGAAFPVFLKDGKEYALARTEQKSGVGYNGFEVDFAPSTTLEEDLYRRDIRMNAIAQDMDTGELIDPFGGIDDIKNGIIHHVSDAFRDDPVRIIRASRFASRYGFTIHPDTLKLMEEGNHELKYVPKERIWAEFEKGLMEDHPLIMMNSLLQTGCLEPNSPLAPFISFNVQGLLNVGFDVKTNPAPLDVRFALVSPAFGTDSKLYQDYKIPNHIARLSIAYHSVRADLLDWLLLTNQQKVFVFNRLRSFNDISVLYKMFDILGLQYGKQVAHELKKCILTDFTSANSINAEAIVGACIKSSDIKQAIDTARCFQIQLHHTVSEVLTIPVW